MSKRQHWNICSSTSALPVGTKALRKNYQLLLPIAPFLNAPGKILDLSLAPETQELLRAAPLPFAVLGTKDLRGVRRPARSVLVPVERASALI